MIVNIIPILFVLIYTIFYFLPPKTRHPFLLFALHGAAADADADAADADAATGPRWCRSG